MEKYTMTCLSCGMQNEPKAQACSRCHASLRTPEERIALSTASVRPTSEKRKWQLHTSVTVLVRNSVLLLLSALLLVFCFMPAATLGVDMGWNIEIRGDYGFVEVVELVPSFFENLTDEEIAELPEMDAINNLMADISMESGGLVTSGEFSPYAKWAISEMLHLTLITEAKSETVSLPAGGACTLLFELAYVLLCLALFILALINFIRGLYGKSAPFRTTAMLLAAVPAAALVRTYLYGLFFGIAVTQPSVYASLAFWLSLAAVVFLIVLRLRVPEHRSVRQVLPRVIAIAVALLTIGTAYLPLYNTTIYTASNASMSGGYYPSLSGSEREIYAPVYANVFDAFGMNANAQKEYKEIADSDDDAAKIAKIKENLGLLDQILPSSREELASDLSAEMVFNFFAICGLYKYSNYISIASYFTVLLLLGALLVIWQNLAYLSGGSYSRILCITAKSITLVGALVVLGIAILVAVVVPINVVYFELVDLYAFSIGAGLILMPLMAIANFFMPTRPSSPLFYVDEEVAEPVAAPAAPAYAAPVAAPAAPAAAAAPAEVAPPSSVDL